MSVDSPAQQDSLADSNFLRACRGEPVTQIPVWFMRQAGRSLPEYRALREGVAMLDSCFRSDLVAEITMQPVRRHGVDAAILFSDIVVPLKAVGVDLDIVAGTGPVIAEPIRSFGQLDQLRTVEAGDVETITTAVSELVRELGSRPLIGFAGAPFTLASYLIEGGPSRDHRLTKQLMRSQPELWHALLDRLAIIARDFLRLQIGAGASAVQLFDSWAGALSLADYNEYVARHTRTVLSGIADLQVPRIHFGVGTGELLETMAAVGADVVGVDWRVRFDDAVRRIGPQYSVQGNLDPTTLFAPTEVVQEQSGQIIEQGRSARGHIFNLGHGVLPQTEPDSLTRLVEFVHGFELS